MTREDDTFWDDVVTFVVVIGRSSSTMRSPHA